MRKHPDEESCSVALKQLELTVILLRLCVSRIDLQ